MNICITGSSGFIGSAITDSLLLTDANILSIVRKKRNSKKTKSKNVTEINFNELYSKTLNFKNNYDSFVHVAAIAHVMDEKLINNSSEYFKVNRDLTLEMAKFAIKIGVKRFIFISSIKVNGESTEIGAPFISDSNYIPDDPYALSKYEAEQGLLEISKYSNMEVVIIRPPLVYGPGVKANFGKIIRLVTKGIPLPLGSIQNCRSYIALDNIVDFILLCADRSRSPKAANQIFLISDGPCISTSDLIRKIAFAYNKTIFLIPVGPLIKFILRIFREKKYFERLFSNLVVDYSKAEKLLNWKPVVSMDEQLSKMGNLYYKRLKDD